MHRFWLSNTQQLSQGDCVEYGVYTEIVLYFEKLDSIKSK